MPRSCLLTTDRGEHKSSRMAVVAFKPRQKNRVAPLVVSGLQRSMLGAMSYTVSTLRGPLAVLRRAPKNSQSLCLAARGSSVKRAVLAMSMRFTYDAPTRTCRPLTTRARYVVHKFRQRPLHAY